jgi:hypothetical protein
LDKVRRPRPIGHDDSFRLQRLAGGPNPDDALPPLDERCCWLTAPQLRPNAPGGFGQGDGEAAVMDVRFVAEANRPLDVRSDGRF